MFESVFMIWSLKTDANIIDGPMLLLLYNGLIAMFK